MADILLASSSPRRKELLERIGLSFKNASSLFVENIDRSLSPAENAKALARGKAMSVAKNYPKHIVIGADTLIEIDGRIVGKPKNKQELIYMFNQFSSKPHNVHTGVAIVHENRVLTDSELTKVYFRKLSPEEIDKYSLTDEWKDKAGGYGIQAKGALFIEKIEGDYYNVVGLPLCKLGQMLQDFGINLLVEK